MLPPGPRRSSARRPAGLGVAPVIAGRPSARRRGAAGVVGAGRALVREQVLEAAATLLHADQRQAEVGQGVADHVVRPVVVDRDHDGPAVHGGLEPALGQGAPRAPSRPPRPRPRGTGALGEGAERGGPQEAPLSMATRKSQTRSISPSRWLATMTAIPNSAPVRLTS